MNFPDFPRNLSTKVRQILQIHQNLFEFFFQDQTSYLASGISDTIYVKRVLKIMYDLKCTTIRVSQESCSKG